jgi:hypothetical protein
MTVYLAFDDDTDHGMKKILIIAILAGLGAGYWLAPSRQVKGICLLLLFLLAVGIVVAWLAKTSGRLSSSGRDPQDIGDAFFGQGGGDRP